MDAENINEVFGVDEVDRIYFIPRPLKTHNPAV
jgi:hypothetical protein